MPPAQRASSSESVFVAHVAPRNQVPLATHIRGTVILSSLRGIRAHGLEERFLTELGDEGRVTIASLTAATWLPMDYAIKHYEACDRLDLDRQTIEAMGGEAGRFINQTVLTVVSKLSMESGTTPWFALSHAQKLVARTWRGSSIAVWRSGPKEARVELIQQPLARIAYFRTAFRPFLGAIVQMFARAHFVRELPGRTNDREVCYRISWV